jgi:hypothetical protein
MQNQRLVAIVIGACVAFLVGSQAVRADEIPQEYQKSISKGLDWLAKAQLRDGHWEAAGGAYPVAMTALSGIAFLMEGSTLRTGKYAENVRRTTDWLMSVSQRNGVISPLNNMGRGYMHDHGYALLFLACVYGEEDDVNTRRKLEGILTRAVDFTGKAQSSRGGWTYTSCAEGGDGDEGSVTVTQLQALRAAKNAGIVVPKSIMDKAMKYLENSTTPDGGVVYSLGMGRAQGGGRPALTAAAIACGFSAGQYDSALVKKWFQFCKTNIPIASATRFGHDEYTNYYYAQAMYMLGDNGYAKMFPQSRESERLTWSKYRKAMFDSLTKQQSSDGSWSGSGSWGHIGPVYASSMALTIMQLDKGTLPIFQR